MIPLAPLAVSACLAITPGSDQILIRDLAGAFPGLQSAAPDLVVALAPAPGVERVFRLPELRRLAPRFPGPQWRRNCRRPQLKLRTTAASRCPRAIWPFPRLLCDAPLGRLSGSA